MVWLEGFNIFPFGARVHQNSYRTRRNKVWKKCAASADICRLAQISISDRSGQRLERGGYQQMVLYCDSRFTPEELAHYVWVGDMEWEGWMWAIGRVTRKERKRVKKRGKEWGEESQPESKWLSIKASPDWLDRGTRIDKWSMRFAFAAKYSLSIR